MAFNEWLGEYPGNPFGDAEARMARTRIWPKNATVFDDDHTAAEVIVQWFKEPMSDGTFSGVIKQVVAARVPYKPYAAEVVYAVPSSAIASADPMDPNRGMMASMSAPLARTTTDPSTPATTPGQADTRMYHPAAGSAGEMAARAVQVVGYTGFASMGVGALVAGIGAVRGTGAKTGLKIAGAGFAGFLTAVVTNRFIVKVPGY
jgi:hypothetical protein